MYRLKITTCHCLILIVFAHCAYAKSNIDSLFTLWNNKTLSKENRLKAMDLIIKENYATSKPDSAFYYAQQEYEFAKKMGAKKYEASALIYQSQSYRARGDLNKAMDYINIALNLCDSTNDTHNMAASLNLKGNIYAMKDKGDSALYCYEQCLDIANRTNDNEVLASLYISIGIYHKDKGEYKKAIEQYEKSMAISKLVNDKINLARSYGSIASVYQMQGLYIKAMEYYLIALKISEDNGNKMSVSKILSNIGVVYFYQKQHHKAIEFYKRALAIEQEMKNKNAESTLLNYIGKSYFNLENYDEALPYFTLALNLQHTAGYRKEEAKTLGSFSELYFKKNEITKAMEFAKRQLALHQEINDEQGSAVAYGNVGNCYLLLNDNVRAVHNFQQSYNIANKLHLASELRNSALGLYQSYKQKGEPKMALSMYEKYIQMRDSIINENNNKEIARQEIKYEYEKKSLVDSLNSFAKIQEMALNKKLEIAQKAKERNLIIFGAIGLVLISTLWYQRKINQNKLIMKQQEAQYQKELTYATIIGQENERKRLARDLHDEVGAMLSTIKMNLGVVNMKLKKSGMHEDLTAPSRNLLDDTISNVRQISRDLLPPSLEEFGLAVALNEFVTGVEKASEIVVNKNFQPMQHRIEPERELALYRVMQEMINNALKHSQATQFDISMNEKDGILFLSFADNGNGFDLQKTKTNTSNTRGLGLLNLETRVDSTGGTMKYITAPNAGTRIEIEVPLLTTKLKAA